MSGLWSSLIGGTFIGLSAVLLLLLNGRIAGISGIVGRLAQGANILTNGAFVVGLALGPVLFLALFGHMPAVTVSTRSIHSSGATPSRASLTRYAAPMQAASEVGWRCVSQPWARAIRASAFGSC